MRKKMIVSLVSTIIVGLLIVVVSFAWYTNVKKTSSVDFVSNGTILEYTINGGTEKNVKSYDVEGVAFFDIDNENEGFYFTDMAVCLELDITNYSKKDVILKLEGETQSYTLSAEVSDNVVSVYSYTSNVKNESDVLALPTRETFDDFTDLYTYGYSLTNSRYEYTKASTYESGQTYYQRNLEATVTLTLEEGKVKSGTCTDDSTIITVLNDGSNVVIERYEAVDKTKLTAQIFEAGNAGFYYTLSVEDEKKIYTHAKEFDSSTQYYELRTVAYLSDLTASGTSLTEIGSAVNGAYITCAISSKKLESKEYNYTAINTTGFTSQTSVSGYYVLNGSNYEAATGNYVSGTTYYNQKPILTGKSVNDFLGTTYSNRYTHALNLTKITTTEDTNGNVTSITKGTSAKIYVYIYGVQPYDNATNNFLADAINVYPFKLTITAE